jgi:hypothetical protein
VEAAHAARRAAAALSRPAQVLTTLRRRGVRACDAPRPPAASAAAKTEEAPSVAWLRARLLAAAAQLRRVPVGAVRLRAPACGGMRRSSGAQAGASDAAAARTLAAHGAHMLARLVVGHAAACCAAALGATPCPGWLRNGHVRAEGTNLHARSPHAGRHLSACSLRRRAAADCANGPGDLLRALSPCWAPFVHFRRSVASDGWS